MAGGTASAKRWTVRGGALPKRVVARRNDWTPKMAEQFIEALADSCNVTLAAKAIGRSLTNVYRRRMRDASFRNGWEEALAIGYSRLEMMLLERALHGVEKVVIARDGTSTVMRDYPDRVALALLRMHRDSVAKGAQPIDAQEVAEARDRILARIARLRARGQGKRGQGKMETKGMLMPDALLRRVARAGRGAR